MKTLGYSALSRYLAHGWFLTIWESWISASLPLTLYTACPLVLITTTAIPEQVPCLYKPPNSSDLQWVFLQLTHGGAAFQAPRETHNHFPRAACVQDSFRVAWMGQTTLRDHVAFSLHPLLNCQHPQLQIHVPIEINIKSSLGNEKFWLQERFCPLRVCVHASVIFSGSWLHLIVSFSQHQNGTLVTTSLDV